MLTFTALGRYGRFANQLYQIAGTIGVAIKSGQPYGFPDWKNYDHVERFGSNEDCEIFKHLVNPLPGIGGLNFNVMPVGWGYHEVYLPTGNWDLQGHFQSPRYFSHCIDKVKEQLKFTEEYDPCDYVAIHYRAGDYSPDPEAYHPRCSKEYYEKAIKQFPEGTKFMAFSDGIDELMGMIGGLADITVFKKKDYIDNFKKLKSCHSFIIANSSYSSFAATIADQPGKKVVAPKKWFGQVAGINGDDIYDENWIVI
jgi:hypothetical protein